MEYSVGFIGLGLMGKPMAERILNSGASLFLYNRTREKADSLIARGARWCDSPRVVAQHSSVVLTMLSTSDVLKEIALGTGSILSGLPPNGVHVDMSTVSPSLTRELAASYAARGCCFLHSPVLGSVPQAAEGNLLMFVGGDESGFRRVEAVLRVLSSNLWRFPTVESASHMKLICNMFIAGMITTLAQALVYADRAGLEGKTLLEVLSQSALNAPMYQSKGNSILQENFAPRFFLEHMLKDISLMLDAARELEIPLPTIEAAYRLFAKAAELGLRKEDYSAVVKVLRYHPSRQQADP